MSLKNSYTTSDCLQWDSATNLVRKLYRDKNYRISLLVGCGIFFGLRISDLLQLTWEMLLNKDAKFTITEKKTSKRREVFESSENAELALVKLMELFNHSSVTITKRYLGLRQEELLNTYDCLSF